MVWAIFGALKEKTDKQTVDEKLKTLNAGDSVKITYQKGDNKVETIEGIYVKTNTQGHVLIKKADGQISAIKIDSIRSPKDIVVVKEKTQIETPREKAIKTLADKIIKLTNNQIDNNSANVIAQRMLNLAATSKNLEVFKVKVEQSFLNKLDAFDLVSRKKIQVSFTKKFVDAIAEMKEIKELIEKSKAKEQIGPSKKDEKKIEYMPLETVISKLKSYNKGDELIIKTATGTVTGKYDHYETGKQGIYVYFTNGKMFSLKDNQDIISLERTNMSQKELVSKIELLEPRAMTKEGVKVEAIINDKKYYGIFKIEPGVKQNHYFLYDISGKRPFTPLLVFDPKTDKISYLAEYVEVAAPTAKGGAGAIGKGAKGVATDLTTLKRERLYEAENVDELVQVVSFQTLGMIGKKTSRKLFASIGSSGIANFDGFEKNGENISSDVRALYIWTLLSGKKRNELLNKASENGAIFDKETINSNLKTILLELDVELSTKIDENASIEKNLKTISMFFGHEVDNAQKGKDAFKRVFLSAIGNWNHLFNGGAQRQNINVRDTAMLSSSAKGAPLFAAHMALNELTGGRLSVLNNDERDMIQELFDKTNSNSNLIYKEPISLTEKEKEIRKEILTSYTVKGVNLATLLGIDANSDKTRLWNTLYTKKENIDIEELKAIEKTLKLKTKEYEQIFNRVDKKLNEYVAKRILTSDDIITKDISFGSDKYKTFGDADDAKVKNLKAKLPADLSDDLDSLTNFFDASNSESISSLYSQIQDYETILEKIAERINTNAGEVVANSKASLEKSRWKYADLFFGPSTFTPIEEKEKKEEKKEEPKEITLPVTARATFEEKMVEAGKTVELSKVNSNSFTFKVRKEEAKNFFKDINKLLKLESGDYYYVGVGDLVGKKTGEIFVNDKFKNIKLTQKDLPNLVEEMTSSRLQASMVTVKGAKLISEETYDKAAIVENKLQLGGENVRIKGKRTSLDLYVGETKLDLASVKSGDISVFMSGKELTGPNKNNAEKLFYELLDESIQSNKTIYALDKSAKLGKNASGDKTLTFHVKLEGKDHLFEIKLPKEFEAKGKEEAKETKKEEKKEETKWWNQPAVEEEEETKGNASVIKSNVKDQLLKLSENQDNVSSLEIRSTIGTFKNAGLIEVNTEGEESEWYVIIDKNNSKFVTNQKLQKLLASEIENIVLNEKKTTGEEETKGSGLGGGQTKNETKGNKKEEKMNELLEKLKEI